MLSEDDCWYTLPVKMGFIEHVLQTLRSEAFVVVVVVVVIVVVVVVGCFTRAPDSFEANKPGHMAQILSLGA